MKKPDSRLDIEICAAKVEEILAEYNASLWFDKELNEIVVADLDTKEFAHIDHKNDLADWDLSVFFDEE